MLLCIHKTKLNVYMLFRYFNGPNYLIVWAITIEMGTMTIVPCMAFCASNAYTGDIKENKFIVSLTISHISPPHAFSFFSLFLFVGMIGTCKLIRTVAIAYLHS